MQQGFFRPVLQGPGDIVVVLGQWFADFPARSKQGVETRLEGLDQAVRWILDVVLVDRYAPAGKQADQVFEFFFIGRASERRQRHHRAFLEKRKAEMFRDAGVDHAQAVEHRVRPLLLDFVALARPRTGGAVIAISVRDQDGGFFKRRDEKYRSVALVMADLHDRGEFFQAKLMPQAKAQTARHIEQANCVGTVGFRAQQIETCRHV